VFLCLSVYASVGYMHELDYTIQFLWWPGREGRGCCERCGNRVIRGKGPLARARHAFLLRGSQLGDRQHEREVTIPIIAGDTPHTQYPHTLFHPTPWREAAARRPSTACTSSPSTCPPAARCARMLPLTPCMAGGCVACMPVQARVCAVPLHACVRPCGDRCGHSHHTCNRPRTSSSRRSTRRSSRWRSCRCRCVCCRACIRACMNACMRSVSLPPRSSSSSSSSTAAALTHLWPWHTARLPAGMNAPCLLSALPRDCPPAATSASPAPAQNAALRRRRLRALRPPQHGPGRRGHRVRAAHAAHQGAVWGCGGRVAARTEGCTKSAAAQGVVAHTPGGRTLRRIYLQLLRRSNPPSARPHPHPQGQARRPAQHRRHGPPGHRVQGHAGQDAAGPQGARGAPLVLQGCWAGETRKEWGTVGALCSFARAAAPSQATPQTRSSLADPPGRPPWQTRASQGTER